MHSGAIVPKDNVAGSPPVRIDVSTLRGLIDQPREERPAACIVHTLDRPGMRRDVKVRREHSRGYARSTASVPVATRRALLASSAQDGPGSGKCHS